jgi:hypothetical protein
MDKFKLKQLIKEEIFKALKEASIVYGNTEVYELIESDGGTAGLFKVNNFPAIKKGTDAFNNKLFLPIFEKILKHAYNESLQDWLNLTYHPEYEMEEINDQISKLTSFNVVYICPSQNSIIFINSLNEFSDGYRTKEDWGGEGAYWKKI